MKRNPHENTRWMFDNAYSNCLWRSIHYLESVWPDEDDVVAKYAPKFAQSTDLNQSEIVDALRKIGCQVEIIGKPVDLLVGFRIHNFLLEVKRPGEKPRTQKQKDFLRDWPGQVRVVETPEEAIRVVTRAYK